MSSKPYANVMLRLSASDWQRIDDRLVGREPGKARSRSAAVQKVLRAQFEAGGPKTITAHNFRETPSYVSLPTELVAQLTEVAQERGTPLGCVIYSMLKEAILDQPETAQPHKRNRTAVASDAFSHAA
jgi:hypothetical protein